MSVSKTGWKQAERDAAALFGGTRYPANMGMRVDVNSEFFAVQVKNVRRLPIKELVALTEEMQVEGRRSSRFPVVVIKPSVGAGRPTPYLVVMPGAGWQALFSLFIEPLLRRADTLYFNGQRVRDVMSALLEDKLVGDPNLERRVAAYLARQQKKGRRHAGRQRG